jgi:hypothetical protein
MVARKDDPIWTLPVKQGGFNYFGVPWGPFDFADEVDTGDLERKEAVEIGLVGYQELIKPQIFEFKKDILMPLFLALEAGIKFPVDG